MSDGKDDQTAKDGNESDFTESHPEDWPEGKQKLPRGTPRLTRFKRGESYADYEKRRRKEIKKKYNARKKEELAALKIAGEQWPRKFGQ